MDQSPAATDGLRRGSDAPSCNIRATLLDQGSLAKRAAGSNGPARQIATTLSPETGLYFARLRAPQKTTLLVAPAKTLQLRSRKAPRAQMGQRF